MENISFDFARPLPILPLPNCVLFPGVVQPLHIFEPRYRRLVKDALADQSAFAVALLLPGWEKDYYASPPIHPLVCVGKIVASKRVEGGKFNLLLHGISRARIRTEHPHPSYRVATMEPVFENVSPGLTAAARLQRKVLRELFAKTALKELTVVASLDTLFDDSVPTPRLIDMLAFTLVQDVAAKQRLLNELDPVKRGEHLLQELVALAAHLDGAAELTPAAPQWPPSCGQN